MSQRKQALIVGCGYVGSNLYHRLIARGWHVDGIRRTRHETDRYLCLDVQQEFDLEKKYDVVFYLVAAKKFDPAAYHSAYTLGVANTLAALRKSGQNPRFVFASSTSLFSENHGGVVTEESAVSTEVFSKYYLKCGESLVAESGLSFSILRFSGIYGPARMRLIEDLKQGAARLKKFACTSNRIHVEDCVGICMHVAELDAVQPLYIASDCEPVPYNELLLWLSARLEVAPPLEDMLETKSVHRSHKRCSNELLRKSGYKFKFPTYREGFMQAFNEESMP